MTNTERIREWAPRAIRAVAGKTCVVGMGLAAGIALLPLMITRAAQSPTYSVLYTFNGGTDGDSPQAGLLVDTSGNLYGTTAYGGTYGYGTVFKVDPSGKETILYSFMGGLDGGYPFAGLVLDSVGNLYGTASSGGFGAGVVFEIDPAGNETVLYSFTGVLDGGDPVAGLLRDGAGNLYGTALQDGTYGFGVVFKLSPTGKETVLHSFAGSPTDGESPFAGLSRDAAGNLYGTTEHGGEFGGGIVFKVSPSGEETVLHNFSGGLTDGEFPIGGVIRDSAGNVYGTTEMGGVGGKYYLGGTTFEISASGTETLLHEFSGAKDGGEPVAGLVRDAAGNLYGTTSAGGNSSCGNAFGCGVVFGLSPAGKETLLYTFTGGSDGALPFGGLAAYKGNLYGTTSQGGNISGPCSPYGCGVIFKVTPY